MHDVFALWDHAAPGILSAWLGNWPSRCALSLVGIWLGRRVPGAPGMRQPLLARLGRRMGRVWVSRTAVVCPAARGRARAADAAAACSLVRARDPTRPRGRADHAREADGDVPEQPLLPHAAGRLADQPPAARGRHGRLRARLPGAALPLHAARAPGAPGPGLRSPRSAACAGRARLRGHGSRGHVGAWIPSGCVEELQA